jgi:hypothetical protein
MELVGARFSEARAAESALREIEVASGGQSIDAAIHALGSTLYDKPVSAVVLAGRFEIDAVDGVIAIIERHGGTILTRRREWSDVAANARSAAGEDQAHIIPFREKRPAARSEDVERRRLRPRLRPPGTLRRRADPNPRISR